MPIDTDTPYTAFEYGYAAFIRGNGRLWLTDADFASAPRTKDFDQARCDWYRGWDTANVAGVKQDASFRIHNVRKVMAK